VLRNAAQPGTAVHDGTGGAVSAVSAVRAGAAQDSNEAALPILALMVVGGVLVAWVLRRVAPKMPVTRRVLWIVGGGMVLAGVIYAVVFGRS
jgi:hypothetical protein